MHFRPPTRCLCFTLEDLAVFPSVLLPPSPPYESIEPSWGGVYLMPTQEKSLSVCVNKQASHP